MKALSIKQPWASLIIAGMKPVENRKRKWKHKGPLAIHASKTFDEDGFLFIEQSFSKEIFKVAYKSRELTGGIIGSVEMIDCVKSHDSIFFFGPYGYVFEDPKPVDLIPWKGSQGVFNIDIGLHSLHRLSWHFGGHYDCTGCGNLLDKYPENGNCPICGDTILPF